METFEEYKNEVLKYFNDKHLYYRYSEYLNNVKINEIDDLYLQECFENNASIAKCVKNIYRNIPRFLRTFSDQEILNEVELRYLEDKIISCCDTDDLINELDNRGTTYNQLNNYSNTELIDELYDRGVWNENNFCDIIGCNNSFAYTKDELKQLAIEYIDKNF